MQQQMNLDADEFSAVEIKLKPGYNLEESQNLAATVPGQYLHGANKIPAKQQFV